MGELRVQVHTGWTCSARSCTTSYRYQAPSAAMWGDYALDRADSREQAEAAGWLFLDGRSVRPFCPAHAAAAKDRHDAIAEAQAAYVANYDAAMAATR